MSRGRKRSQPSTSPKRRLPAWGWAALVVVVSLVAYGAFTTLESRRAGKRRDAVPSPDLGQVEPRVAAAIATRSDAVRNAPDDAESWGLLGATFEAHGLYDAAESSYASARSLAPDDFRWTYLLAIVRDVNGADADEVERLFRAATQLRDDYGPVWLRLGHALSLRGSQDEAREALERAVALEPDSSTAHRELGQVLLALDEDAAAFAQLTRAVELNPSDGSAWSGLAQALSRGGRTDDARRAAERARQLRPATALRDPIHGRLVTSRGVSTVQLLDRAGARIDGGNFVGALETLGPLLDDRPDDPQVRYLAGTAHARLGNADAAREHFDAALATDPEHVGALLESGALLEAQTLTPQALELYQRAHDAAPQDPQVLASLARAHALNGDDWGAARAFEQWAAVAPLDARSLMNWGNALTRLERVNDAVDRYRAGLRLQPDYAHLHFNLALALEELRDRDGAVRHYREAARLDPTLPAAQALARLGVTQ